MKICTKCGDKKSLDNFNKDKNRRDGLQPWCRNCLNSSRRDDLLKYPYYQKKLQQTITARAAYINSPSKLCYKCGEVKDKEDFGKNSDSIDGKMYECKLCKREHTRLMRKFYSYGITNNEYEEMVKSQNNKCLLCGVSRELQVDHSHDTNKIRGLLCRSCNTKLGWFENRVEQILTYIGYNYKGE